MTTKEQIKAIIKQYADKGKKIYRECCDDNESASLINYWDGYRDCAYNLLRELDDMQEECNITGIKSKHATGKLKELVDNVSEEGLEEARKQLEELTKECMYSKDSYTDEDRKVLCDGCEEECKFNQKKVLISENLLQASIAYADAHSEYCTDKNGRVVEHYIIRAKEHFIAGAKWQLNKAINWLKSNINCDIWINNFIKNMEGKV